MSDSIVSSKPVAPWRAGLDGARANILPGLALQAVALAIVLGYYFAPGVAEALRGLTEVRARWGVGFSMLSTALAGGLIPWLYLRAMPATRSRYDLSQGVGLVLFWAAKGVEVHLLYAGMAALFGTEPSVGTVVLKSLLDQLVYGPFWAVPGMWLGYQWIEHRFNFAPVWARVRRRGWYGRDLLPVFIANLGIWAPTVALIYVLPVPLQLPMQNLVLCFFTLLMAHLSQRRSTEQEA
ncbi:hypothetical protein [Actomonas aquatica]|uniref:Uncharacterized protein n=1 Tax=Actomonas aquatica TaxID=2866162 RepID=A0ABZ1C3I3_9BACT|nr:hypothetical protein [Opitutus sp. WL0086]WRQ86278.1 hypothetical protein K1X11_015795 [Opitutus sp. WL0086]